MAIDNIHRTYAIIAFLLTLQSLITILCSQNALISMKCVSPDSKICYLVNQPALLPANEEKEMTICPIAIAVGCAKCPAFKVCPAKGILGDQKKETPKSENKPK